MKRHDLDLMSLLSGLFFALIGVGFLLDAGTAVRVDVEWLIPAVLIAVGLAGLGGALFSARSEARRNTAAEGADADLKSEPMADR